MNDNSAHDETQISHSVSDEASDHAFRIPIVARTSFTLLFSLNCAAFIAVGLGFLLNLQSIYPRASNETPVAQVNVQPETTDTLDVDGEMDRSSTVDDFATIETGDDGVSTAVRILDFVQFSVLLLIGVVCGLVSLGCLALISDRPFGDFKTGIIGVSACLWLSALALFVPAPEFYLIDPIQYSVAAIILWASSTWLLGLGARVGFSFSGGLIAALGIMALGSRIVVWATWS